MKYLILFLLFSVSFVSNAQNNAATKPITDTVFREASYVNFDRFLEIAQEARDHRAERLVSWDEFQRMSNEPNTIILDTRSKEMYDRSHIKGAVHLNFADFNVWSLQRIAPDPNTRILIYCNNNFDYPLLNWSKISPQEAIIQPYISKGTPIEQPLITPQLEYIQQGDTETQDIENVDRAEKVKMAEYTPARFETTMALNVPTYINLYGYGYRNVYELGDLISLDYSGIEFEGTDHNSNDRSEN